MFDVMARGDDDVKFWNEVADKPKSNEEWKKFFEGRGFRGAVDYPPSLFYK